MASPVTRRAALIVLTLAALLTSVGAQQSGRQGGAGAAQVFRSQVEIVELDVFASDGQGRFVEGLTAADFEVLEDGKLQQIALCELIGLQAPSPTAGEAGPAFARPGDVVASNASTGPERFYILILDDLQAGTSSAVLVQNAAVRFIEHYMEPGDTGAVVFTSGFDKPAQSFTSDRALLLAAVGRYRVGRPGGIAATTDVLAALATYLAGMQGSRKTAIFVGPGVVRVRSLTAKDLVGSANRAMLSFFVVDPSGLHQRAGQVAATDTSILQGETTWTTAYKMKAQDNADDLRRWLADETGGFAVLNTNDMDRAMSRIKAEASQYYLLGYYPSRTPKPGASHTLTVRTRRPGITVRARKGYTEPRGTGDRSPYQLAATNVPQPLLRGLEYPARLRSVRFTASASVTDGPAGSLPVASVSIVVNAADLALSQKGIVDYAVVAVGADGRVVGHDVRRAEVDIDDATRARLLEDGLRLSAQVALAPGAYTLRVSLADAATGRVGSLWMDVTVPPAGAGPQKDGSPQSVGAGREARVLVGGGPSMGDDGPAIAWLQAAADTQAGGVSTMAADLSAVLQRAGRYVAAYGENTSVVVATEDYTQRVWGPRREDIQTIRTLVSEFAMVPAAGEWHGFRDVLEVDGKRVRDRDERLLTLFTSQRPGALGQGRRIADESARYNVGPILRNFNLPTMALAVLQRENQSRFRFERKSIERVGDRVLWRVGFKELARPTLIRTAAGTDMPAKGTIWLDSADGTVWKSALELEGAVRSRAKVTVGYERVPGLGLLLPSSMDEEYENAQGGAECRATYRDYRRFDTSGKIVGFK